MFIFEGVLLIIGSVFASTNIPLEAILYQNDNKIATFQSHLNKDIGDSRFKLSLTHQQGSYKLKFTLGSGRVYGSNTKMSDTLVFRPIANSPLIGIVELIIEELPYVLAIFLEKSQQGHKEIPSASGRTYEEIITPLLTSNKPDISVIVELLFYYEFLLPAEPSPHVVRVQVESTDVHITLPLSIRSLNIRVINRKDSKDEMEMIRASFAAQGSVCQIKDVSTRFVRFEGNSFYFVSDDADTGSKWLIALSAALRVWSVTGIPESSAIGGLRRHDQTDHYDNFAIRTVIENVFEFQKEQDTHKVIVLDGEKKFYFPDDSGIINLPHQISLQLNSKTNTLTLSIAGIVQGSTILPEGAATVGIIPIENKGYIILSNLNGVDIFDVARALV